MAGKPKRRPRIEDAGAVPVRIPTILLDVVAIEEVPVPQWHRVLDAIGYPPGLTAKNLSHNALLDHVGSGLVSEDLVELLQVLHDIGTDHGVDAMKAVAEAHQHDLGAIGMMAPREAAVQLWLAQRSDPTLQELFTRIQMQAETRREPRTFREYVGKTTRAIFDWKSAELRLRKLVQEFCKQQSFGDHIDVRGYVADGDARVQVVHAHRLQKPLVVREGETGRGTIAIRPVHCDIVRYDAATAWLRVSPRSASSSVLEHYRRIVGEAFFEDPDFFSPAEYTLRPLQDRGREALDDPAGVVLDARLVEVLWERGDEQSMWLKAPDCFADADELGLPIDEGNFVEAKIALRLIGKRTTRRTVTVKVPNKVEFPRDEHESAIEGFLKRSGIQRRTSVAPHRDLWSLAPWHHEARVWREAYPRDVDPLVKREILLPRPMAKIAHPDYRAAGRALDIDESGEFGASSDESVPPRLVTGSDVDGLALNVLRLGEAWRVELGLDGEVRSLGGGALMLGHRRIDSTECSIVALTRKPTGPGSALARRVLDAVAGDRVAVLVPAGRTSGTALAEISVETLVLSARAVWREFVRANKLTSKVAAIWSAPPEARLVVDRARQLVWIDGLPIDVVAESHPYRLLVLLAEAGGAVVSHGDIGAALSGKRVDAEAVSKKAKHGVKVAIARSFAAAGKPIDAETIVCGASGGYRLGVAAHA